MNSANGSRQGIILEKTLILPRRGKISLGRRPSLVPADLLRKLKQRGLRGRSGLLTLFSDNALRPVCDLSFTSRRNFVNVWRSDGSRSQNIASQGGNV